jgi:hypothetical protein
VKAVEQWGMGGRGVGRLMEGVKWTPSGNTLRNPLNIDLNINNKRQDCKIGTVCVCDLWEGEGE